MKGFSWEREIDEKGVASSVMTKIVRKTYARFKDSSLIISSLFFLIYFGFSSELGQVEEDCLTKL